MTPWEHLRAGLTIAFLHGRLSVFKPMRIVTGVVAPVTWMCLLTLPRFHTITPTAASRAILGSLLASLWSATLWSGAGIIRAERRMGTLTPSLTGRLDPLFVVLCKTTAAVMFDFTLIGVSNILFCLISGLRPAALSGLAIILVVISALFSGVAISIALGGFVIRSRHAQRLIGALSYPVLLFTGTIAPLSVLPPWVAIPGRAVNLFWLMQSAAPGSTWHSFIGRLMVANGLSLLYAAVGIFLFYSMIRRARVHASLDLG